MDLAVSEYKKRRAERLAARESGVTGIRPKINSNWDWPLDVTSFQKRRNKRLVKRGLNPFRLDAPDDEQENNGGGGGEKSGGHGNTRLPFGLCKRYGIEIGAGWTPKDAWDALAGKGITPDGAYGRLKRGEDPGTPDTGSAVPKTPNPSRNVVVGVDDYKVTGSEYKPEGGATGKKWVLKGTVPGASSAGDGEIASFDTKREMLQFLKEQGVEEFPDPETGEIINPKEMELPAEPIKSVKVGYYGGAEYGKLYGRKVSWASRGSNPWYLSGDKIAGTGDGSYSPSRWTKSFWTKADMMAWLKEQGVEEFKDPETGEIVNPQKLELPEAVLIDGDGTGYQDISIGLRGGKYTIIGTDFDGKKRKIMDCTSLEKARGFLSLRGMDPDKAKVSASLKKREAERVSWLTSDKKEYVERDGVKYGDLSLEESDRFGKKWDIVGEDESGTKMRLGSFTTKAEAMKFLKEQGVEKIREGKERPNPMEYEVPPTVARIGDTDYQKLSMHVDRWGMVHLYGTDLDGQQHEVDRPRYGETYGAFKERISSKHGLTDAQIEITDEDQEKIAGIQKAEEEKERRRKEFEDKAVAFGSSKYTEPHLDVDSDGDYSIYGYDKDGDRVRVSGWGDLYDMDHFCEQFGYQLDQFIKKPELKEKYEKYKEMRKDFDAKAVEIDGRKYADLSITYDGHAYHLRGMDARGRTKEPLRASSLESLGKALGPYGFTEDSFPMDDAAKKQAERGKKAKELIASGSWYGMGIKDSAYKDVYAQKDDTGWKIIGTDMDGNTTVISSVGSWDDAVSSIEGYGVKDYKVRAGGKEYGMPKDGMHGITLMRKPGGGFAIMASTRDKPRAKVYETDKEADARKWLQDNNVPTDGIKTRGMNPNDDVVRTHTQKSLENFDTHRMKAIEGSFIDDMTEAEKKEAADMLTEIFSKGEYRSARGLKNFGNIIENGYKSQLETGTGGSGAAITRSGRQETSKTMFGHGDLKDEEYEKMGYLAPADDAADYDDGGHPFYGPMTFTFKKENMKDRATYTWGDSLNTRHRMKSAGYAGEHPTIEGFTSMYDISDMRDVLKAYREYKAGAIDYDTMFKRVRRKANNNYIEMQFNGPVTVDDISKASWQKKEDLYRSFNSMSSAQRKRVLKILKDKGVQLVYRTSSGFVDAWDALKERYSTDMPA